MRMHISRCGLLAALGAMFFIRFAAPVLAQAPNAPNQPAIPVDPKEPKKQRSNTDFNGKTLYDWARDLKDKDPSIRERAIANIKAFGDDAREYSGKVVEALKDPDVSLRVNAAITLGWIGIEAAHFDEGVKSLVFMLQDRQGIARFQAINSLAKFGPYASAAVGQLILQSQSTESWEIRQAAVHALGEVGWIANKGFDARAFSAVVRAMDDRCMEVRYQAVQSLIRFGQPTNVLERKKVLHVLGEHLTDKEAKRVVIWTHVAIMRIEDNVTDAHLAAVGKHLSDGSLDVRIHAARALGTVGPQAFPQVPNLIEALADKHSDVIIWSCWALGRIGPKADKAISHLERLSQHADEAVRVASREALDAINARFKPAADNTAPGKPKPAGQAP
jgi:HEAT repeat protein